MALRQVLDAVRVKARTRRWKFEAAYSDSLASRADDQRTERERRHVILSVSRRVTRAARASVFLVHRDDRSPRGDTPTWLGAHLASRGEPVIGYWAQAAMRRGRSGTTQLRGWAADSTVTVRPKWSLRPAFSVGYARATGDATTSDGTDGGFRQTGLQDNAARFGTWRRMRMYGEVFDPELSNLQVLTLAAGLRPRASLGVDAVFHDYRQIVLRRRLGDHALDARANGRSAWLGREVDVQVVARVRRRIDLLLSAGVFLPGNAFDGVKGADRPTVVLRPQVRVFF